MAGLVPAILVQERQFMAWNAAAGAAMLEKS